MDGVNDEDGVVDDGVGWSDERDVKATATELSEGRADCSELAETDIAAEALLIAALDTSDDTALDSTELTRLTLVEALDAMSGTDEVVGGGVEVCRAIEDAGAAPIEIIGSPDWTKGKAESGAQTRRWLKIQGPLGVRMRVLMVNSNGWL